TGLPVTTDVVVWPTCIEQVSITHAMIWSLVLTSGAGTSFSGPMASTISATYRRVSASISRFDIFDGSQVTPPLPPPNGMCATAHFQVIQAASAVTSSRVTAG